MATEWEYPLVQDKEGTGYGYPVPLNPSGGEGIITDGIALSDVDTKIEKVDGEIAFSDANGNRKLSTISSREFAIAMSVALG